MAREMGVPREDIERSFAKRTAYVVWPENWSGVEVFQHIAASQWNLVGDMAGTRVIGLRYESLPFVMDVIGVPAAKRRDVLWCVQIMEREVVKALNDRGRGD